MIARTGLLIVGALLLAACGGEDASGTSTGDPVSGVDSNEVDDGGERLPDVDLVDLATGETSSLTAIEGPAVINLWATWCAPCRAEIPDFEEVHQARGDEIRFVGINVGEDASAAQEFIDDIGATYDQFADPGGDVSTALRATAMPVTVVIDADGTITTRHLGPLDQEGLDEAIDEAIGLTQG